MAVKLRETDSRIKVHEMPEALRSGGETRPYEYPHLYQIQAGDWRISYAVEQNHLAILVLEVLNADGTVRKDPARETLTRKMKVKLLDWPEGSPSRDLPPEDLGKRVQIKLLDMADEVREEDGLDQRRGRKIRLRDSTPNKAQTRKVTLLDHTSKDQAAAEFDGDQAGEVVDARRVTPLDSPSM
jgi:hypothetical protein